MFDLPFKSGKTIRLILPKEKSDISATQVQRINALPKLFNEHRDSLERELGGHFEVSETSAPGEPQWLVGPFDCNQAISKYKKTSPTGPEIFLDRKNEILITDGKTLDDVEETFSYLRSLRRFGEGVSKIEECSSVEAAIDRIKNEVQTSYPSFAMKGINWNEICEKHIPRVLSSRDSVASMQEWLAELQDAHTWIRPVPPLGELSYGLKVENGRGFFTDVPENSLGWKSGLRPGCELLNEDFFGWWRRTAAPLHAKPFVAGRRVLSAKIGNVRELQARRTDGKPIHWVETVSEKTWDPLVEWRRLPSGNGYIKIRAWILGKGFEEIIDDAFRELKTSDALIVDLRGNPGGNLLLAQGFRNRFLRSSGIVGFIQTSLPDGSLAAKEPLNGEPAPSSQRWMKSVRFLTDPMTYSASEDALLGLQGLSHVKVIGQRSGGGSGRMRLIRLLPGWRLTVSTALTFDVHGHCIEGQGIPVDIPIEASDGYDLDSVLKAADFGA